MKLKPVQILTRTALLLALMLAVQVLKNISPWITGPIINAILFIATMGVGLTSGIALSVIAPVTALLLVQQPLMVATGYTLVPVIMLGNILMILPLYFMKKKDYTPDFKMALAMVIGSVIKWLVMLALLLWVVFPLFPNLPAPMVAAATNVYTVVQIGAALIGSVLAFLVWIPLKKALKK